MSRSKLIVVCFALAVALASSGVAFAVMEAMDEHADDDAVVPDVDDDDSDEEANQPHGRDDDKLHGRAKKFQQAASSAGVAKGDFNGDGFADLAVGVPLEDVTVGKDVPFGKVTVSNAGAVNVIYGSATGLTATDTTRPASQFWTQNTSGILDDCEANDSFGAALAAGDFNGDGFSDLAIAVRGEVTTIPGTATIISGAIQILYGSSIGLTASGDQFFRADQLFSANSAGRIARVGNSLVWGDFNGDGIGDLAVEGAPSFQDSDIPVAILFGAAAGLNTGAAARQQFTISNARLFLGEPGFLGDVSLSAGRLNGDGFDDLAVGMPFATVGTASSAGAVQILFGTPAGITQTGSQTFNQNSSGVPETAANNDRFGFSLAVGDFNADGFGDLAVGVPGEDNGVIVLPGTTVGSQDSIVDGGAVNIFFGTTNGLTTAGSQILFQAFETFIEGSPFGDLNPEAGDLNGTSLAAGDFDDDGFADLAIGAPGETIGNAASAGSVAVFYGSSTGFETTVGAGQFWSESSSGIGGTSTANDRFGSSLTAWNFGRNHNFAFRLAVRTADLAIGILGKDVSGKNDAGAVRVIYGFDSGLATSTSAYNEGPLTRPQPGPSQLWHQDVTGVPDACEASDQFGSALY